MYKARLDAMGRMVRTRVARLRVTKMYLSIRKFVIVGGFILVIIVF